MASILQTDLLDLVNQWEERVAFNEGYRKQKISAASGAGRDAFSSGLSRSQGQDAYFQSRQQMNSEASEFLAGDSAADGVEGVDIEPIDEITDGEESLGMESCVSGETVDVSDSDWYQARDINSAMDAGNFEHLDAAGVFDDDVYSLLDRHG